MKFSVFFAATLGLAISAPALSDDMFAGVQTVASDDGWAETIEFTDLNSDVMRMEVGDQIDLNFGSGYVAELDRITTQEMGSRVWTGRIAGQTINNRVIITETNGDIFGRVQAPDGLWYIITQNGQHSIVRMPDNATYVPYEGEAGLLPTVPDVLLAAGITPSTEPNTAEMVPVGSNGTVDIAIFYSDSFSALWGLSTGGRIQYLLAILDQALIDSDTGLRARLVHMNNVSLTTDNADMGITLSNLAGFGQNNNPPTQDLSALRAAGVTYGADLVAVLQRCQASLSSAGLAYLPSGDDDDIDAATDVQVGFSVSADWIDGEDNDLNDGFSLCDDVTFAHEIGHNLGFAHNVENAGNQVGGGVRPFAHGHRVDGSVRTIMAYSSGTAGEVGSLYFSNPSINLCGPGNDTSCGIAAAGEVDGILTNDPADNARAAREESLEVTTYRPEIPRVVSAVLPVTRSVQNGTAATAFATIINPNASGSTATACGLRLAGSTGAQFSYQTTTPANALSGTANTAIDIPQGAAQNFVFSVTSAADFVDNTGTPGGFPSTNDETNLFIEAFCTNRRSAEYTLGLNSLIFSSSTAAPADVIALAATVGNTGRVDVPTTGSFVGAFSVAVTNVGTSATIVASADVGGRTLAIQNIEICQTDPGTGACDATGRQATRTVTLNQNDTATFAVFVRGTGAAISNDPARNRVFVRFDEAGTARGATSVAVRTQ